MTNRDRVAELRERASLAAFDYQTMMDEARRAFANSADPDILKTASVVAERIATNPECKMSWDGFIKLNRR
ncbi:hypothetical protein AB7M17_003955 [Bradyrhizobium sp. USDA 377]